MDGTIFHADELAAQQRAGGGPPGTGIRDVMPDQHRSFFSLLPYLFVAAADAEGWPLATMLTAAPGFVTSPDPRTLHIAALPAADDPVADRLAPGAAAGLLGLDLSTRRRNRANGTIASRDERGITVAVHQSFGNCPQYIQRRSVRPVAAMTGPTTALSGLDDDVRALIGAADTLFVASRSRAETGAAAGLDISHRGGRPGFVAIEGDTLVIPDFRGNRYFNTLGNLLGEPRGALLFVDFDRGDLLQLQGTVEIDWSGTASARLAGAERSWRFTVARGWLRRAAVPLRWSLVDYAPTTLSTGIWHNR